MTGVALMGGLIGLVIFGMPIGFALACIGFWLLLSTGAPLDIIPISLFDGANKFPLLAIPLFMVVGELMDACNLSRRLVNFAASLVGFIRGGLAHITVVTSMFFAEISGSAVAGAAALGSILIPEMKQKGYPPGFAATIVSVASTMAIILPPSIPMILYGVMAQVSVSKLFIAGIIPGLTVGATLILVNYIFARKLGFDAETKFSFPEIGRSFKEAIWALVVPVIILGGIWGGIFTPTEAAAVAVVAALLIGSLIYKKLTLKDMPRIFLSAANQTAIVMIIISASALVGWFLTAERIPQELAEAVTLITNNKYMVLAILNVFFLVVGMILHSAAAIIMLIPILMPLITQLGIDPIHFGIIVTINLGIGQQTPPVASVLLTTCTVGNVPLVQTLKYLKYYLAVMLLLLALFTYIPWFSLWLPGL